MGRKAKVKKEETELLTEGKQTVELVLTLEVSALTLEEAKEVVKASQWRLINQVGNFISLRSKKVK